MQIVKLAILVKLIEEVLELLKNQPCRLLNTELLVVFNEQLLELLTLGREKHFDRRV